MHYPMLWLALAPPVGVLVAAASELSVRSSLIGLLLCLGFLWLALRRRQMVFLCAWVLLLNGAATRVAVLRSQEGSAPRSGTHTFQVTQNSEAAGFISQDGSTWTFIEIKGEEFVWRVPKNFRARMGNRYRSKLVLEAVQPDLNGEFLEKLRSRLRPQTWMAVSEGPTVLVERAGGLRAAIDDQRIEVALALAKVWQGDYLGVALALALGTRRALPERVQREWNDMGISHLLAISGLHMGLVGLFLFYGVRILGTLLCFGGWVSATRRTAALVALTGMWLFCGWVGSPISAIRACFMGSVLFGALLLKVGHNGFNALGLAGVVMILRDPQCLLSIGAWLSFGCTWFLLLAANRPRPVQGGWVFSWLTMTAVPWLATLPLCALYFGEIYLWGVPANLFAITLATWLITPAALLGAFCCFWGFKVPVILEWMLILGIDSIQTLLQIFRNTGWTSIQVSWAGACLLSVAVWPWLVVWLRGRSLAGLIKALVPGLSLVAVLGVWTALTLDNRLQVYMPYVGHGDATLVEFPTGEVMLVDAGGTGYQSRFDPGEKVVAPLLRKRGHTHIDYVVMSHPDHDHIGGLEYILDRFSVGELWVDERFLGHVRVKALAAKVRRLSGQVRAFQELPEVLRLGDTKIQLIYPRRVHGHGRNATTNQRSLVFRIEQEGRSILFTGDLDETVEKLLAPSLKPTELLKVAHHGSKTSSSEIFLEATQPCLALVSSSRRGRGQFPHPDVVHRYRDREINLFQTKLRGALEIYSTPTGWQVQSVLQKARDVHCSAKKATAQGVHLD